MQWWSEQTGILIGALGGGGVGIIGGLFGSMVGFLAPRGKARGFVLGVHILLIIAGAVALIAWFGGQPRHVFFPLLLGGGILTVLTASLYPVVLMRYRQAEQRRMDAKLL